MNVTKKYLIGMLLMAICFSCSNNDDVNIREGEKETSDEIPSVLKFAVDTTYSEKQLLVRWVCPDDIKIDMIEVAYRDTASSRRTGDPASGIKLLDPLFDKDEENQTKEQKYTIEVPYYASYEVTVTAIGKNGQRSLSRDTIAQPNYHEAPGQELTTMFDRAASLMATLKNNFFGKTPSGGWQATWPFPSGRYDGDATVQGQAAGIAAFLAMREAAKGTELEATYTALDDSVFAGVQHYLQGDSYIYGDTLVYAYSVYPETKTDRYYGDNAYVGINMVDWYMQTKEQRYLDQAKVVWNYLSKYGWDDRCGGGILFQELQSQTKTKNTCSTAPTAVFCCKMYQATGEQKYLDFAIKCYDWLIEVMQDPYDSYLFKDNVTPDERNPTTIDKNKTVDTKYSYNSGQPLQAACLLYKITGEQKYLDQARVIAKGAHKRWFASYLSMELDLYINIFIPGNFWFHAMMSRGFFELYSIDKDPTYINDIQHSMLHAWTCNTVHQPNNLLNDDDMTGEGILKTNWEIVQEGAIAEVFARLAKLEREGK